ncbi:hypothetical protein PBY51_021688 [Eleginops maclovinus]|uniref:Macrophage mannose receptor 1 n=1 Tax=Eleginops maclovinus TaxID=56733 RepID=A0AAN7XBJ3_ELEMC|nr:hypothetical protein PBY51_021688 [Eleginops maclovinus]
MKITCTALVFLIQTLGSLALDDSPFQLTNKDTGFCLVKNNFYCHDVFWTNGDRLQVQWSNKCLGAQGKSVGSEISLYVCDETSQLQKWECNNGTVLALKGQKLYIELTADNTAVLSKTIGPNNHLTISGTSSGACARTYREWFTIEGNANGRACMFPFQYKDRWYSQCTTNDNTEKRLWCAVQTNYDDGLWGYCPTNSKEHWNKHTTTGAYYQINTNSALTWAQAEASCKQQVSSLLSITDPHQQAYVTALLGQQGERAGVKLWTGLIKNPEHGWHWSNERPFRYLNWYSGHPLPDPGYDCGIVDPAVQYSWQSSSCTKKLGYICYSERAATHPTTGSETGFCSSPWIPYNGHCFHLNREQKTWSDAQKACRQEGGDLVSIRNVEDQSFVISQLGYASNDELWIGLNDKKTERLFDWIDHSDVTFTSWESGRPAVLSDPEDCVLIRGENGNWADRVCDEKHGFICMKMSASEPSGDEVEQDVGCKTGWKRHGSYCYHVGTETKTFDEAKSDCKRSDSYLADVSNGVDNAFLVSLVGLRPEKYFWLGLSNQNDIDVFVWTNSNSVRFTHWNAEMPGHQQGCVAMTTGVFAGLWDLLPCTNKEKYICKHLAEGAVRTPEPPTRAPLKCADGWTQIQSRNFCFKLFPEPSEKKRTWYEARDYCRTIGGDLLSIHNKFELTTVQRDSGSAWIGLSAPDPVTGYVWSDGSPVNFLHWVTGEPDNINNVESCAEFRPYVRNWSGFWSDVNCEKYNQWLCQIRTGATPKPPPVPVIPDYNETSDGWLEWNGTQYYINNKKMAMEQARHFCQQRHADLVTINSEAERVFLWKQMFENYISHWIGLNVDLDETYEWMDSSPVVFQSWSKGQPIFKYYDESCVIMGYSNGYWYNYNCGYEFGSICKRSGSPPANTTVAPTVAPKGGCPPHWKQLNHKCYKIIKDQKATWKEAREQCKAMGGNLASISSRHVEVFLITQMADTPTTDLWIGLRSSFWHSFYWTDGQPRTFLNVEFLLNQAQCAVITTNSSFGVGKWIQKYCNETYGFVCLQSVDPSFPDSPEPMISRDYVKILNDSIKVVTQNMSWHSAKMHCEGDGARLVSLQNIWSQAYVELLALNLKAPLWIGLNKNQTNRYFRYIDGWFMKFSYWGKNEPSRDRPCVYVDVDGQWKTADCKQTMNFVCMKSTDVPPTEPSVFTGICPDDSDALNTDGKNNWIPFHGYCYKFVFKIKQWGDASVSCVRHGGSLASIEHPFEQDFIQSNIHIFKDSHSSFWIGLFKTHKGKWLWLDKTIVDYTYWAEDQPNEGSQVEISALDGTWNTNNQLFRRPYICKTPKADPFHHDNIAVATVMSIIGIATGAVIAFFLYKKFAHRLSIPVNIKTFDNPLFFSKDNSHTDVVDTDTLSVGF